MSEENNLSKWKGPIEKRNTGRKHGSKNKVTQNIRKAYQDLVENNLDNMSQWIAQIAYDDPKQAMDIMIRLSEYVIPRLARTELTARDGEDLFKDLKFNFGPSVNDLEGRDQSTLPPADIEDIDAW